MAVLPSRVRRSARGCSWCDGTALHHTAYFLILPITGSSFPRRASRKVPPYLARALVFVSGFWSVTRWERDIDEDREDLVLVSHEAQDIRLAIAIRRGYQKVFGADILVLQPFGSCSARSNSFVERGEDRLHQPLDPRSLFSASSISA